MFKSSRWRSEKNKIKALFKLQFQATQVPEIGWDNLWVSLIPLETGKVAVKTVKAIVQNGICSWETPVYQTVKLMKEPKTGKFEDKIYHFLVSNGSSKTGFLGEVSINFADYAEAFKPSSVSLSLKNSNSSTVLNVKIQRLPVAVDGREAGEDGNLTERSNDDRTVKSKISDPDADQSSQASDLSKNSGASGDLMMKERALENSKQTYLKKEKDLQVRIEELEKERFQAYSFESQHEENLKDEKKFFAEYGLQDVIHLQIQETRDEQSKGLNAETPKEKIIINKNLMESGMRVVEENPDQNTTDGEQLNSTKGVTAMEKLKAFSGHTPDPSYIVELVSDMELLMRKNKSMEGELKEMQERYSEISLKFAEVEGERQQLTMTIRNLKHCKRN